MKRMAKLLGLAVLAAAILTISVAGTVSAAGGNAGKATQNQGAVCPCGDCVCGDCEPNDYSYNHNYLAPGPHRS